MTERQHIINALLNVEKEEDFKMYLLASINEIDIDTSKPVKIMTNGYLPFINKMYPNVNLVNYEPNKNLLFFNTLETEIKTDTDNFLTYSFSVYDDKKADFKIGLGKNEYGVYINQFDKKNISKMFQIHPYVLCDTRSLDNMQIFLTMIGENLPKEYELDVYVPNQTFKNINNLNFNKLVDTFHSILLYHPDKSVQTVTYNEKGRILRIKTVDIKNIEEFINIIGNSLPYNLIEINNKSYEIQHFINIISNFHDKTIFTGNNSEFFQNLKKYTHHIIHKSLVGYKYKKEFLDVCSLIKPSLDPIIKLGIIQSKIKDILNILNNKKLRTYNKLEKLFNLFK